MPFPQLEPYGSPEWFRSLPLPSQACGPAGFAVEHRIRAPDGTLLVHQQIFDQHQLVA